MIRGKIKWLLIVAMSASWLPAQAQNYLESVEDVFHRGVEFGVGARAMGMGGAFLAVGDDYTASYWNPAALAQIRRFEVLGSLSHLRSQNDAAGAGLLFEDKTSFTRINALGFAYPVPTYRGSLVFSVGYNRLKPYDSNFNFEFFNNTPDDSVTQRWTELEEGSLNNWTFAGAVDVAPNFSVGLSLNLWSGKDDYQFSFVEQDNLDLFTFRDFRQDDNIVSEFSGFNVKLGGLYRLNSNMRLGATIATPTTLTVTENYTSNDETNFDDGSDDVFSDEGSFEYKIRSPFVFGGGASMNFAGLLVAGSAEYIDWSQIRYTEDPPVDGLSKNEANEQLARDYREVIRLRAGAEYTIPLLGLQVRAGYYLDPSPFAKKLGQPAFKDIDREFFTYGVGFLLNKQVKIDVAYMTGDFRAYNPPLSNDVSINEKVSLNKIVATMAFRL